MSSISSIAKTLGLLAIVASVPAAAYCLPCTGTVPDPTTYNCGTQSTTLCEAIDDGGFACVNSTAVLRGITSRRAS